MRKGTAPAGLALLVGLFGCPTPRQYEGLIPITPGAAERNTAIMGHLRGPEPRRAAPARVHVMKRGEEIGGSYAVGRPGDLVLENDEVVFVIDQLASRHGFAETGGNVVDAADAKRRIDELGQQFTYFGAFPRQAAYEAVSTGTTEDGAAWVEVRGHELREPGLKVTTRYTLRGGDRALLIETTVKNASGRVIEGLTLGDAIEWGGTEKVAPGKSPGFRGHSEGPYLGGIGQHASYAITSTDGTIEAMSGGGWSDTIQRKDVTLKPWEGISYARVLVVGERPDSAALVAELVRASGGELGSMRFTLVDRRGAGVAIPDDARVDLSTPKGEPVLWIRAADGVLEADVPPGTYLASYVSGGGRSAASPPVAVEVRAGNARPVTLPVGDAGRLIATCVEGGRNETPVPCKLTIEGIPPTRTPDFGPGNLAGPARRQVTMGKGAAEIPLPPGRYHVVASRGPEYALATRDVTVAPLAGGDRGTSVSFSLARVVDTAGYVAADLHQHTALGADAAVTPRDRVISNAAEGVEVAVASEHNRVPAPQPLVRELGLEHFLVEIPGTELTSDATNKPWGHANVFPLPHDPAKPRGGAPDLGPPRTLFEQLRALPSAPIVQVNHPRHGQMAYFDRLAWDARTGVGKDPDYSASFDALEVWNGRHVATRQAVLEDFLALLRSGHPVTPTANSDSHTIVGEEPGYPRTFVRVSDDAHLEAWSSARDADFVRGLRERRDVVLTNGPFLRVTANGAPIGGVATGRTIDVRVHVESAPWVTVDQIEVVRVSGERIQRAVSPRQGPKGAMVADVALSLRADRDDAFVVIARGRTPLAPVLAGDPDANLPWAMTGALWIDADGDGKSLGRTRPPR